MGSLPSSLSNLVAGQPADLNFLSPTGFKLVFNRLPNVIYFLQKVELPVVHVGETSQGTPVGRVILGGDHTHWGTFPITFKIDEAMTNYYSILEWMVGLGPPINLAQVESLAVNNPINRDNGFGRTSDAILSILNAEMNPNVSWYFKDLCPLELGAVQMQSDVSTINYVTCDAMFEYSSFYKL